MRVEQPIMNCGDKRGHRKSFDHVNLRVDGLFGVAWMGADVDARMHELTDDKRFEVTRNENKISTLL